MKAYLDIAALAAAPRPMGVISPRASAPAALTAPISSPQAMAPPSAAATGSMASTLSSSAKTPNPSLQDMHRPPARSAARTDAPLGAPFTDPSLSAPYADQADGLRRIFTGPSLQCLALVANPHVVWSGVALERLAACATALGRTVLVLDAADSSPEAAESAALGLAGCIDRLPGGAYYLAARGLPRRHVDTLGSAASLLDAAATACPQADLLLVHAEVTDVARLFKGRQARPLLLSADQVDGLKHAYAGWKLLAQRCGWLSADLLLMSPADAPRTAAILRTLAQTADQFLGGVLSHSAVLDPIEAGSAEQVNALIQLLEAQLSLNEALPAASGRELSPYRPASAISVGHWA